MNKLLRATIALLLGLLVTLSSSKVEAVTARASWVESEIYQFNHPFAAQLPQELETKMQKMAASPFGFFRGTAHLFYQDMRTLPASHFVNSATSAVWLVGDIHPQNMGAFRDSQEHYIFNTTDFDEGYLGPYVWDLRRMAVGIVLAAQENELSFSDRQEVVRAFLDAYLDKMSDFKGSKEEAQYRLEDNNTQGVIQALIQKSQKRSRSEFLEKYTTVEDGESRVFQTNSQLKPVTKATYSGIVAGLADYIASIPASQRFDPSYYRLKDIRLKLGSGTGSLGRYRYFLLIEGSSDSEKDDRILEMKQAVSSAVAIAAPGRLPAATYQAHEGRRVAMTMRAMLANPDPLLGYTTVNGISFVIREKSPYAVDFDYTQLTSQNKFLDAADAQGKVLATNHALADKDQEATIVPHSLDKEVTDLVAGQKGVFKDEMVAFAVGYAAQVESDYNSFQAAYQKGAVLY